MIDVGDNLEVTAVTSSFALSMASRMVGLFDLNPIFFAFACSRRLCIHVECGEIHLVSTNHVWNRRNVQHH